MKDNINDLRADEKLAERRKFIKKAGQTALTAPAVALLLSMENRRASASAAPISGSGPLPG